VSEPDSSAIDARSSYAPDGTDLTLIRWMLSMTPDQRLDALQGFVDALWELKDDDVETGFPLDSSNVD